MIEPAAITDYTKLLEQRLDEIDKLQATPDLIRAFAINVLDAALKQQLNHSTRTVLRNGRDALENITHGSIAENFEIIYAQMCVLAVSNLEAILKQLFEDAANDPLKLRRDNKKLAEIRVTLNEMLSQDLDFDGKLGKLIIEKDKPNFQDLKAIKDRFDNYFGKKVSLNKDIEKELCFYLEARHVLVHRGGIVDAKFMDATSKMNANLKDLKEGEAIALNEEDWSVLRNALLRLMSQVSKLFN